MLLVLLVVGAALLAPRDESGEAEDRGPSSYSDGPGGLRALYLTCEALRMPVARWTRSLDLLDPRTPAVVAVLEGTSGTDLGPLREWVEAGGRLLLGSVPPDGSEWGGGVDGFAAFELRTAPAPSGETLFAGELAAAGIPSPRAAPRWVFEPGAEGRALAEVVGADGASPWILSLPLGSGEVLAVADASFLRTERLDAPGSAVLAVRLLEAVSRGEPVAFCETIHGYLEGDSPIGVLWGILRSTAPGHFAIQACAAALLLLFAGAPRFGRVRKVAHPPRRSEYEYVDAVAGLLRRSGGWGEVARLVAEGVRRRWNLRPGRSRSGGGKGRGAEIERGLSRLASAGTPERILESLREIEGRLRVERGAPPERN